jgi:hypothetical protein
MPNTKLSQAENKVVKHFGLARPFFRHVMILKIFSPKNLAKKWRFYSKFAQSNDHSIGLQGKRQFFRQLGKIAENCDNSINPDQ